MIRIRSPTFVTPTSFKIVWSQSSNASPLMLFAANAALYLPQLTDLSHSPTVASSHCWTRSKFPLKSGGAEDGKGGGTRIVGEGGIVRVELLRTRVILRIHLSLLSDSLQGGF